LSQSEFPQAFIRTDGYFERGYLRGQKGLHPSCRFTFRPFTAIAYARLQTALAKVGDRQDQGYRVTAEMIVRENHLVEWDVVDSAGKAVDITVDNLLALRISMFSGITGIIRGTEATDIDDNPEHLQDEADTDLYAKLGLAETAPEVADAKNSATG
jgi:hypothetical protein